MSTARESAWSKIKKAQEHQKHQHDKKAKDPKIFPGDRIFVYTPAEKLGEAYKFARGLQSKNCNGQWSGTATAWKA